MPGRLESAKVVGADVTINCKEENLKDRGRILLSYAVYSGNFFAWCKSLRLSQIDWPP